MSKQEKIICLGKEFNSEEERREYFRNELRTKLPELKIIEGFPIGEDEDIINLSDPPYYTACPNPWLNDFIAEWEKEKENIKGRNPDFHVDEPYASDVSEGKNNPVYNAHSYHTKVPHPAIMRYILHYTQPGDIILDGFGGTGMTGVAARMCGSNDPMVNETISNERKTQHNIATQWGHRNSICSDLSPFASYLAYNLNVHFEINEMYDDAKRILNEAEKEINWIYQTEHSNKELGKILYVIWSECMLCPSCQSEVSYWDCSVDSQTLELSDQLHCPECNAEFEKKDAEKAWETDYDIELKKVIKQIKTTPVRINYLFKSKRYNKRPDKYDLDLIKKIKETKHMYWFPTDEILKGDKTSEPLRLGYTHIHHYYTRRNLIAYSTLWKKASDNQLLKFVLSSIQLHINKMRRFQPVKPGGTPGLVGTLYFSSLPVELSIFDSVPRKLEDIKKALIQVKNLKSNICSVNDAGRIPVNDNFIDYIFTDPPFGANLMYSELNYLWEAWLEVRTNNVKEAIENKTQGKSLLDYQELMTLCFKEYYRILKHDRWMTVEFSNTSAAVWNGIQTALQRAGFVVANVSGLDKKQGSFNAVTNPTSVKQDLVISCYKPSSEFESNFSAKQGEITVWDFVDEHIHHLPTHIKKDNNTTAIVERSPKIIFDRLITFYLMRGLPIPIDARNFQEGLKQRFVERDGMYFTSEQAAEYDEKKAKSPNFVQLSLIVTNESDAIEWLKDRLRKQAQKYQDIMPDFRIATQSLRKGDTLPELQDILNESFIQEADGKWRTPDPNEAKDREALRNKVLLKEFNGYVSAINQPKAKKLKEVRVEALRAGFKNSWEQKDFKTIVTLGDKIPQTILLEDEQLLMYYDIAKDRV
jgi:DNA modification methylase